MDSMKRTGTVTEKIAAFLLIAAIGLLFLGGCSSNKNFTVLEYEGVKIPSDIYRYWLSSFKYYFVSQFEDITDTAECWNSDAGNGTTVGEYVEEYTLQYAKSVVCALKLFEEYSLKLDDAETDRIDESIDEMIYYKYGDSKAEFNKALMSTYGITVKSLRKAFVMEAKVNAVEEYLFGENGKEKPTISDYEKYYKEHYMRLGVIMVNTAFEYTLDSEGNAVLDENGDPVKRIFSEEEVTEKKEKVAQALIKARNGEDFMSLVSSYSELKVENRQNGFYLCSEDYETLVKGGYDPKLLSEVMKLNVNEVSEFTLDDAAVIVKRLPLIEGAYKSSSDAEQFSRMEGYLITEKYDAILRDMLDDIYVDDYVKTLKTIDVKKGFI